MWASLSFFFLLPCDSDLNVTTTLPVWNLNTGKQFEHLNFKHPASIQCVKISTTKVYSSCDRGLVKIWDMEKASLVRVRIFLWTSISINLYVKLYIIFTIDEMFATVIHFLTFSNHSKVIDAHRGSVKCLFLDEWHLLSGDINGQVMAWSINYGAKECLITFNHPK